MSQSEDPETLMDDQQIIHHLRELAQIPGLSGREYPLIQHLQEEWSIAANVVKVSPLGSLHVMVEGEGSLPRPSVLFAAHLDTIGLMVTGIEDGFIRVTSVGGVDARVLPGQEVIVHGKRDLPGVIHLPPSSFLPSEAQKNSVVVDHILIDVPVEDEKLIQLVEVGDGITFRSQPQTLGDQFLTGPALDNRASIAAMTCLLDMLSSTQTGWDVWIAATSQEEENMSGARTSAHAIAPDVAVVVDVTFASAPGAPDHKSFALDCGITLGWGPTVHPVLHRQFASLAEDAEIPVTREPLPARSGTDADVLQISAAGVPTMLLSIPLRYMHTPVEMVHIQAIKNTALLASQFLEKTQKEFIETIIQDG